MSFSTESKKRRRTPDPIEDESLRPRRHPSITSLVAGDTTKEEAHEVSDHFGGDVIRHWITEGCWPPEIFQASPNMDHLRARKTSNSSLGRKKSNPASSITPSDQRSREEKSASYQDPRYEMELETKGVFMKKSELGITRESKDWCTKLLNTRQSYPTDTLFDDTLFEAACEMLQGRNEAKVVQDIARLLVPSAESFAVRGQENLKILTESVNEGWNNSILITTTRPQPDYSVGFDRKAFSDKQLDNLAPFIGKWINGNPSFFVATYRMFFPFLACEVKCGAAALDDADRQNAHSMAIAARATVELFRKVKREAELQRQLLSFSISHDHRSVRIYGYYPVINGKDVNYYRHPIHTFDITTLDGKDKWTTFQFTKNVYDLWMPLHLERICSAIDQLPPSLHLDVDSLPDGLAMEGLDDQSTTASSQHASRLSEQQHHKQVATPESLPYGSAKRAKRD